MPKAITSVSPSPFHNLPAGDLVDQLGILKSEIAVLEGREKALRDELLRRAVPAIEGALFGATITEAVRWTLDAKATRAEMGEAWWTARCRQSLVTTVAVKPIAAVAKLAA